VREVEEAVPPLSNGLNGEEREDIERREAYQAKDNETQS